MLARSRAHLNTEEIIATLSREDLEDVSHVRTFESRFCDYIGAERCYATNQARAALLIALRALDLSPGDEVLVPDFTYEGVVDAVLESGATPVFVEPALQDFNVPASHFAAKMTERTRAVIVTHLFGIPCEIGDLPAIARENGCVVIEDCAQCLGAEYKGRPVGSFGDFAVVSFNYEKHLTTGEGGMLAVN
ncbi:MAG TPA: aminotransferase class I/II-fold pyridoxal phosphate-dependent enzyme, partial [Methanoculleus sp.]|nr:aminotransferase class I/II-fold pyridoxal phosphate-dependent enzyme [Methanoculleus sp.]